MSVADTGADRGRTRFQTVFVCTANRFRSPFAAGVLRHAAPDLPVEIMSRGTLDVGPMPPLIQALHLAPRFGLDVSTHRAHAIRPGELVNADLVVGFERAHVLAAVAEGAARPAVAFTLPELIRLLDRVERPPSRPEQADSLRALVSAAHALREAGQPENVSEIEDPIGKSARQFQETAQKVHDLGVKLAWHLSQASGQVGPSP
jgi:protein-tyrosine-phosphatase